MRLLACALILYWPLAAAAQPHSVRECGEGGDFIRNAARARDNGITREFFVGRLEEDLVLIRSFQPDQRWFVHDEEDEAFLRAEVAAVFDMPVDSEQHRADFLERCTQFAGRTRPSDT